MYPTGLVPGNFYGTVKKHKILVNRTVEDLALRTKVSNIGTASYYLPNHLAKSCPPPYSKSEYALDSSTDFLKIIINLKIPSQHKAISFEFKALFTSVSLDYTIELILKRVYDNHENSLVKKK